MTAGSEKPVGSFQVMIAEEIRLSIVLGPEPEAGECEVSAKGERALDASPSHEGKRDAIDITFSFHWRPAEATQKSRGITSFEMKASRVPLDEPS